MAEGVGLPLHLVFETVTDFPSMHLCNFSKRHVGDLVMLGQRPGGYPGIKKNCYTVHGEILVCLWSDGYEMAGLMKSW